jgi:alkylation response protein AidB-like acyl-CoA dehydrogenase
MLRKAVREFANKKIAPNADEWDANHYLPVKKVIRPMVELGFLGVIILETYGGEEMGWLAAAIITEEIARTSSSLRFASAAGALSTEMPGAASATPLRHRLELLLGNNGVN